MTLDNNPAEKEEARIKSSLRTLRICDFHIASNKAFLVCLAPDISEKIREVYSSRHHMADSFLLTNRMHVEPLSCKTISMSPLYIF
jgi:hypothetical protein